MQLKDQYTRTSCVEMLAHGQANRHWELSPLSDWDSALRDPDTCSPLRLTSCLLRTTEVFCLRPVPGRWPPFQTSFSTRERAPTRTEEFWASQHSHILFLLVPSQPQPGKEKAADSFNESNIGSCRSRALAHVLDQCLCNVVGCSMMSHPRSSCDSRSV